jgi:hypothetical protein
MGVTKTDFPLKGGAAMSRERSVLLSATALAVVAMLMVGCSSTRRTSDVAKADSPAFQPRAQTLVRVGEVQDESPQEARSARMVLGRFDPAIEMREALAAQLRRAGTAQEEQPTRGPLTLNVRIIDYRPGNALVRWLVPGTGRTILAVEGQLTDADGRQVHTFHARRTVNAGDGNTLGQWHKIFGSVAADLTADVTRQLRAV